MEEEEQQEEEQENTGLTAKDIEHMGANLGINKGSCTYDNFVQALVKMVNIFLGNELMSDRINLDCLKVMEGQSCDLMDAVTEVFMQHEKAVKDEKRYKDQYYQDKRDANRRADHLAELNSALRLNANSSALLAAMCQVPDQAIALLHIANQYTQTHE
tara:strand:+ start:446 stop:919 length:474 start_codon:yes stop_codon:yes gene_type:complete